MTKSENSDTKAKATGTLSSNQPNQRPTSTSFVGSDLVLNLKKVKFDYGDGTSGGGIIKNLRHVAEHMGTTCTYRGAFKILLKNKRRKK